MALDCKLCITWGFGYTISAELKWTTCKDIWEMNIKFISNMKIISPLAGHHGIIIPLFLN